MTDVYTQPKANAIRLVQITQETEGTPGSLPFGRKVYKCLPVVVEYDNEEGADVEFRVSADPDRAIYVANLRDNGPLLGGIYLVTRLNNGKYIFDNQMAFLENQ